MTCVLLVFLLESGGLPLPHGCFHNKSTQCTKTSCFDKNVIFEQQICKMHILHNPDLAFNSVVVYRDYKLLFAWIRCFSTQTNKKQNNKSTPQMWRCLASTFYITVSSISLDFRLLFGQKKKLFEHITGCYGRLYLYIGHLDYWKRENNLLINSVTDKSINVATIIPIQTLEPKLCR